ncbi:MAG: DUF502 domain-containing protein [Alphaproteobacteria bacterium]|nr:DUF502 domain-containing protein [Alphaproteobacteria bacterium]
MANQDQTQEPQTSPEAAAVKLPFHVSFATKLRTYFLTGIIVTAPIAITAYITWAFVDWVDEHVTPLIPLRYHPETYLPFSLPGLGVVVMLVSITLVGFLAANLFGRTLIRAGERVVNRMPVVRGLYNALKQIFETVISQSSRSFREAVLLQYPRAGLWTIGFVTGETQGEVRREIGEDLVNVYVPTTPNPTSGFLLFVPRRDLIFLDMAVDEAAKFVISIGVVEAGERIRKNLEKPAAARNGEPPRGDGQPERR